MTALAKVEGPSLTELQAGFVEAMLEGLDPSEAKVAAGYDSATPTQHILASAAVQAALDAGCDRMLRSLRAKALKTLDELLDPKTPSATRFNAVKLLLDQADGKDGTGDKPLTEMGIEELEALIRQKEAGLKDVTPGNGAHREGSQLSAPSED